MKDHQYFKDVDFQLLKNQTPPIIPKLNNNLKAHNIEEDRSNIIYPLILEDNINHEDVNPLVSFEFFILNR
jgi:hypothetical protein